MSIERRKFERLDLESLSSPLYFAKDHKEIDYSPINISPQGLSIYTAHALPLNTTIILKLDKKDIELLVKWCTPKPEDIAFFRCGLETTDKKIKLDELIQEQLRVDS